MKHIVFLFLLLFALDASAQRYPHEFPEDTTPSDTDAFYTQEQVAGTPTARKILLSNLKLYYAQDITISNDTIFLENGGFVKLPGDTPDSLYLSGDTLYVFGGNTAIDLSTLIDTTYVATLYALQDTAAAIRADFPATSIVDSTRLTQDSILVYYQGGSEVGRDTITGVGGGGGSSVWTLTADTVHISKTRLRLGGSQFPESTGFFNIQNKLSFFDNGFNGSANYFFGDIEGWSAAHSGAAYNAANNLHYWWDEPSGIRAEFENNAGLMHLYIEGKGAARYGLQDTSANIWSWGYENSIAGRDLLFGPGFGLSGYVASLDQSGEFYAKEVHVGVGSAAYPLAVEASEAGLVSRIYNTNTAGRGLLVRGGGSGNPDLLKVQSDLASNTPFISYSDGGNIFNSPSTTPTLLPSAAIQISGTDKGLLHARLTTTQRNALTGTTGLEVFNTTTGGLEYWNGSEWRTGLWTSLDTELCSFGSLPSNMHTFVSNIKGIRVANDTEESYLQVVADDAGSVTSGVLITAIDNATANHHWSINNRGTTASYDLDFIYGVTTASGQNPIVPSGFQSVLTLENSGQVGIGVTDPVNKLDIEGALAVGATYSGTTAAPTNGAIIEGNTGIGLNNPTKRLEVVGTFDIGGTTHSVEGDANNSGFYFTSGGSTSSTKLNAGGSWAVSITDGTNVYSGSEAVTGNSKSSTDGTNTTLFNHTATQIELGGQRVDLGVISPTAITGNTDDYSPTGLATTSILNLDSDGAYNLTGINASSFSTGTWFTIVNKSAFTITLKHQTTSSANNQFTTPGGVDFTLPAGEMCRALYINSKFIIQK